MLRTLLLLAAACVFLTGCRSKAGEEQREVDAVMARHAVVPGVNRDWLTHDVANVLHVARAFPPRGSASDIMQDLGSLRDHEGGDIGFGLRESIASLTGGMTTCATEALVFEHRIAELKTVCGGSPDHWSDIVETLMDAAGGKARQGPEKLTFTFRDPELDGRALAAVAKELGPTAPVQVPAELQEPYDELRSPLGRLVFGSSCYEVGEAPAGRRAMRALVKAGRFDLVGNVARGPSLTGRVYAAEALLERGGTLSTEDAATIAKIRALPVPITTCAGCGGGQEVPAAELLK